jgi:hypothetical protein
MIRISSESELRETFRSIDRDQVQVPADFHFPLALKNFTSWVEPSGHRVYLVFEDPSTHQPVGIVFQRTHGSAEAAPAMCQWCHAVRGGARVSLLTAAAGPNRRVGIHLCSDLKCGESEDAAPGVNDMRESLSAAERVQRLMGRMHDFAKKNLF